MNITPPGEESGFPSSMSDDYTRSENPTAFKSFGSKSSNQATSRAAGSARRRASRRVVAPPKKGRDTKASKKGNAKKEEVPQFSYWQKFVEAGV